MDDVYAAVIHDVKNQMAELALRLGERGDARQEVAIAMNAARRLSEMLLVHRQASDLLGVHVDSVNPADFLAILAAEYHELFPGIAIEVSVERAPNFAFFDDALVRMALANVVHNACRYAQSRIRLAAYPNGKMLVFEVVDDGDGYPDMLADGGMAPASVSGGGTGLGLYLARKIAELHHLDGRHGYVELGNAGGAVFRMTLP